LKALGIVYLPIILSPGGREIRRGDSLSPGGRRKGRWGIQNVCETMPLSY